MHISKD